MDLTSSQTESLQKMRETFASSSGFGMRMDDSSYLRYLRARNFDVSKASTLLNETLNWRQSFGLESVETWKDMALTQSATGKMYVRGYDNEGHALIYMKPGLENLFDHDGSIKYLVHTMEKAVAGMNSRSNQEKLVLLIDFDGFSLFNSPPMKTSLETLHILQNHYPERLHRAYLAHPHWIFNAFWNMVYPFIDNVTKEKVIFLPYKESVQKTLASVADLSKVEPCFGGDDHRLFSSERYVNAPFHMDYLSILEEAESGLNGVETTSS